MSCGWKIRRPLTASSSPTYSSKPGGDGLAVGVPPASFLGGLGQRHQRLGGPLVGAVDLAHDFHVEGSHRGQATLDPPELLTGALKNFAGALGRHPRLLTETLQVSAKLTTRNSRPLPGFHIHRLKLSATRCQELSETRCAPTWKPI